MPVHVYIKLTCMTTLWIKEVKEYDKHVIESQTLAMLKK